MNAGPAGVRSINRHLGSDPASKISAPPIPLDFISSISRVIPALPTLLSNHHQKTHGLASGGGSAKPPASPGSAPAAPIAIPITTANNTANVRPIIIARHLLYRVSDSSAFKPVGA